MRTIIRSTALGVMVLGAAAAHAQGGQGGDRATRLWDRMCSSTAAPNSRMTEMADRLAQRLSLSETQMSLLRDVANARQKAREDAKGSLCSQKPDVSNMVSTFDFWTKVLDARVAAMKAVRPKLEAFYNALDEKQKASLPDTVRDMWRGRRDRRMDGDRDREYGRDDDRFRDGYGRRYDRYRDEDRGFDDRYQMRRDRDEDRFGYRDRGDDGYGFRRGRDWDRHHYDRDGRDDDRRGRSSERDGDWD